jgi:hypothetical protein
MKTGHINYKVVGFDSWTGGAHHYQRLIEALNAEGMSLSLVHIGSWGSDRDRPSTETIGALPVRDISSYPKRSLLDILDVEQPDAVIFLSTETFAHRAFNRYCALRGIPTINLYHGLVRVQAVDDDGAPYKLNPIAHLKFISERLLKALTLVWPTYAGALWRTKASGADWRRFASDILLGGIGRFSFAAAADAKTDACCVYVEADVEHAVRKYGFSRGEVTAVGNPDLVRFELPADAIGSHLSAAAATLTDVMYIDTGLVYTGYVFGTQDEFKRHLIATKDELSRHGKRLVFKPHPDHRRSNMLEVLAAAGVEICSNEAFASRLARCCASIVEPSSLAVMPALLGMPLLFAQYGKLSGQRFGRVLTSYPRSAAVKDLGQVNELVAKVTRDFDVDAARRWIADNAGPLPADRMPSRVAHILAGLIERAEQNQTTTRYSRRQSSKRTSPNSRSALLRPRS